jgi:competence protein ComEC
VARAVQLSIVALAAWSVLPERGPLPELLVLDVGQGDAMLLRVPGRRAVLVDGGGTPFSDYDVGREIVVPALRALGVRRLDLVVASHADVDHIEGLQAVLRAVPVGGLVHGVASDAPAWRALAATARAENVPLIPVRRGNRFSLGDVELHVLHPGAEALASARPNDESVVLRVDWRGRPWALLAGDVSSEVERTLPVPPLHLLVAPHHGSAASTGADLLRAARPRDVAISVGRNRYGHPAEAVLERISSVGATVARTDQSGTLSYSPAW